MENKEIIRSLRKTATFMEIMGENAFKVRALNNAIFTLERLEAKLKEYSLEDLLKIDGIGKSIGEQIHSLISSGTSPELERLSSEIPEGVRQMQTIGGLGAKKIRQLWQEFEVDSIGALQTFIDTGQLAKVKGFGAKTIKQISEAIAFSDENRHKLLWAEAEIVFNNISALLDDQNIQHVSTGAFRRQEPVIEELTVLVDKNESVSLNKIDQLTKDETASSPFNWRGNYDDSPLPICFRFVDQSHWANQLVRTTGPAQFVSALKPVLAANQFASESEVFAKAEVPDLPPELRGTATESSEGLLTEKDIRGVLHAHSTYSDGQHSMSEMIEACIDRGYEYFGITDHSRSSYFYANGLFENRVIEQFKEVEELRNKYPDFTIFKGIECDILTDGKLDYADDILSQFDFIIASVHSVLNMDKETATRRLIRAIENPYTTMLGHLTGRLLLRRQGYPLNMAMVLDACAANDVSVELNANPRRLDIDHTFLQELTRRQIKTSINPDAHSTSGIDDIRYGVQMARKGGITAADNLTSYTAAELSEFFVNRKNKRAGT